MCDLDVLWCSYVVQAIHYTGRIPASLYSVLPAPLLTGIIPFLMVHFVFLDTYKNALILLHRLHA